MVLGTTSSDTQAAWIVSWDKIVRWDLGRHSASLDKDIVVSWAKIEVAKLSLSQSSGGRQYPYIEIVYPRIVKCWNNFW